MSIFGLEPGDAAGWFANLLSLLGKLLGLQKRRWSKGKKGTRLSALRDAYFASEYTQNKRTDKAILHIRTKLNGRINGTYSVLYELNPDSPNNPEKLKYGTVENFEVSGSFLYENLILITFENDNDFNHHAGSFLLEINNNCLFGKYTVYYPDVPFDRSENLGYKYTKNQAVGEIEFWPCSKTHAKAFINREIPISSIKMTKRDL